MMTSEVGDDQAGRRNEQDRSGIIIIIIIITDIFKVA